MSLTFDGTDDYVSLGVATDVYRTRPFTFACLFDSTSLRGSGSYETLYSQGTIWYTSTTNRGGWSFLVEAATNPRFEYGQKSGNTARSCLSTLTITRNNGPYLFVGVVRDGGTNTVVDFFSYSYRDRTLTVNSGVGISATHDSNPDQPETDDPTYIGCGNLETDGQEDFMVGGIGWVAIFAGDLGGAGSSTAAAIWELIARGPWGMLDSNCKLFVPFANAAQDLSGNGLHGTLTNGPAYAGSVGPGEAPFVPIIPIIFAPAGATPISASDSASLAEASGIELPTSDTATLAESAATSATASASDTGALADSSRIDLSGTDTLTLAESVSVSATLTATDTAGIAESSQIDLAASDSATAAEASSLSASGTATDSLTLAEASEVGLPSSDTATLAETSSSTATLSAAETAALAESSVIGLAASDSVGLTETSQLDLSGTDSASLADASSLALLASDALVLAEAATSQATLSATDAAALADASSLDTGSGSQLNTADSGALMEALTLSADLAGTDAAAVADVGTLAPSVGASEAAALGDAAALTTTTTTTDSVTLAETSQIGQAASDAASLTEMTTIYISASDALAMVESVVVLAQPLASDLFGLGEAGALSGAVRAATLTLTDAAKTALTLADAAKATVTLSDRSSG